MKKMQIGAILFILFLVFISAFLVAAPVRAYVDDWPMFRHDPQNSGSSTSEISSGQLLWQYYLGGTTHSNAAIVNGVVYVGSWDGYIYALNAFDGSKIWRFTTLSPQGESSPAVANGVVYVASETDVYAINAVTGLEIWQFPTSSVECSPTVVNGVVYIGSFYGFVYALNASNGSLIWDVQTGGAVSSAPAVVNGIVYTGSKNGYLYALNASTGSEQWSYDTKGPIYSSPAVNNGIVYVGSESGSLFALNANNGALIWYFTTSGIIDTSPAVANNMVYFSTRGGYLYALNAASGAIDWEFLPPTGPFTAGSYQYSSAAVANDILYYGAPDSNVYALNATLGNIYWSFRTGAYVFSSPTIDNGVVYVGSYDGYLYALGAASVSPTSGSVGSSINFRAVGLLGLTSVNATLDNAPATLSASTTDISGALSATFIVPPTSFGSHIFTVTDGYNNPSTTFWTTPTISLNSSIGNVGSTVKVTGTGLVGSQNVSATFAGTNVTLSNSTTDSSGNLNATFSIPASPVGSQVLQINDGTNLLNASFSVLPSISLSPTSGRVNSAVTLSGAGFSPSSRINATFAGQQVLLNGSIKTDAFGSFSAIFAVPNSTAGIKQVVVLDQNLHSASGSYNVTSVFQPITVTMFGSTPPATVVIMGGNPSPSTFLADGTLHSIIMDQGVPFTLSFNNSNYVRIGFNASGDFSLTSNSYDASTTPVSATAFEQLNNIYSVTGPQPNDTVILTGTYLATNSSTIATLNSGNNWNASAWTDYGTLVTFPATSANSGSNERWSIGKDYSTGAITSAGTTYSEQYYHQYKQTLSYAATGGALPSAPVANGASFGSPYSPTLTMKPVDYWFDASGSITLSTPSTGAERWLPSPSVVPATSPGSQVITTSLQCLVTLMQANLESDSTGAVVTVSGVAKGYTELPFSLWVNSSDSVSFSYGPTISSASLGKQYVLTGVSAASPLVVSSPISITGTYKTQYQVTFSTTGLESDATGANSTAAGPQWVDSGTSLQFSYANIVSSSIQGKQYLLSGVTSTSPLTVTGPTTTTATYVTQYQVSFTVSPATGGTTSPTGSDLWLNAGKLLISASPKAGYAFSTWLAAGQITFGSPGSGSTTAAINGAGTITANFTLIYIPFSNATIMALKPDSSTATIQTYGNVTTQQISSITLTPDQAAETTTLSFNVTGPSGTTGFSYITIPKSESPYGDQPVVYIDGQKASNQGTTQDSSNFYVFFSVPFPANQVTIKITQTISPTASPTEHPATPSPSATPPPLQQNPTTLIVIIAAAIVIVITIISIAFVYERRSTKQTRTDQ
ncbi:MAG TPA: PQQ-binding-like beta-propeller repeat protein [Candidatus Nanoarchaeia archaeon]|nr:PQQ-binding-like beta-propeller repeat protein [Candidatus Nanoarchaeia archaeon]